MDMDIMIIFQSLIISLVVNIAGGYVLLKVLEERVNNMRDDISTLKTNDGEQVKQIAGLQTSHTATVKVLDEFRKEYKEEARAVREALVMNTSAISALQALIERIEKKLN